MRVGDTVIAFFYANPDTATLSEISASDQSVLAPRVDPAATVVRGGRLAKFEAIAPGKADITATESPLCPPGVACPAMVMLISVHVLVAR